MANETLHTWKRGDQISSVRLNQIRDAVLKSIRGGVGLDGLGINVTFSGDRLTIQDNSKRFVQSVLVRRLRVKEVKDDYLRCFSWTPNTDDNDGEEGDKDIFVAKPYLLRKTPFDGESIVYPSKTISYTYASQGERTATSGADSETQVLIPEYFVDDEILAIRNIIGSTGVVASEETPAGTTDIGWEDMNTAGRFWAKKDE